MIYRYLDDLLYIAGRVLPTVQVRDAGLPGSVLARPAAGAFGADAYPDLHSKAAALLDSLVISRGLFDGNRRLALAAVIAFLGFHGQRLTLSNDEAYELVMAVASGQLDDVAVITARLRAGSRPR